MILIKRALGHQKWVSESPGIGHRTRFRLLFHHRTLPGFFGEVSRRSSNLDRQPILKEHHISDFNIAMIFKERERSSKFGAECDSLLSDSQKTDCFP